MGTPLVTAAASLVCPHGGAATVMPAGARVTCGGRPVAVLTDKAVVSACPFQVPVGAGTKPQPCTTVGWTGAAARVFASGQPVVLQASSAVCSSAEQIPQGPPVIATAQAGPHIASGS